MSEVKVKKTSLEENTKEMNTYTKSTVKIRSGMNFRKLSPSAAALWEDELRGRLGLLPLATTFSTHYKRIGWALTLTLGLVAALTRFFHISHPHKIVFDETYYVKDAYSLLHHGFEARWDDDINEQFANGDYSALHPDSAERVVHPPLGKWLMAIGQALFGSDNGLGWRFTTAIAGVIAVMFIVRIALKLFHSPLMAGIAGLAVALDGMGIVMSRTGILDNLLALFFVIALWGIIKDREYIRSRLAHQVAHGHLNDKGQPYDVWGPKTLWRPWLLFSGAILGLSCGIKWSGIYPLAVFGILVFLWGISARKAIGTQLFFGSSFFREGLPAFIQLVPIAIVGYLASWTSWFISDNAWDRQWAHDALERGEEIPVPWAGETISSFVHYHIETWNFHHELSTPHTYQSQAWDWLTQSRPVSFYWVDNATKTVGDTDVEAITSIGNIAVWWIGLIAFVATILIGAFKKDWRAGLIIAGYLGTWAPWLLYSNRTIFQFYAIVVLPFVALSIAYTIGTISKTINIPYIEHTSFEDFTLKYSMNDKHSYPITAQPHDCNHLGFDPQSLSTDNNDLQTSCDLKYVNFWNDFPQFYMPPQVNDDTDNTENEHEQEEQANETHSIDTPALSEQENRPLTSTYPWILKIVTHTKNTYKKLTTAHNSSDSKDTENAEYEKRNTAIHIPHMTDLGFMLSIIFAILVLIVAFFWYPIWIGAPVSREFWEMHMWFDSWI
ncbi:MAG: phospholipid carrier-dependent glycosyltransferase [Actinomycetaceae bacterium]|nr:phospholipid carrier-dependent glycosyltransferase [Actinomycetaceae bacterium]